MLKPNDIRDLAVEEIEQRLRDVEEELFNLKFRRSVQQIENPLQIRFLRRDLARIRTILNEHKKGIITLDATTEKAGR
ncbi:MAG: 50S ribosomal protein L29 [candidate division Zixibacteria bacterium]|nr:50S ribosomal protein L29 [candidate division Zixibacteria bacterium]